MGEVAAAGVDPVRATAIVATAAYATGVCLLTRAPASRAARIVWLCAWGVALGHTLTAFGVAHHWSHAAAVAHTEAVSGYGFGVTVNEAFLLVWLIDAGWRLRRPPPRWWTVSAHGFLAFIVFNAAVVFGSWPARVMGLACVAAWVWCARMKCRATSVCRSPPPPGAGIYCLMTARSKK